MTLKPKQPKHIAIACYTAAIVLIAIYVFDVVAYKDKKIRFPFMELALLSLCTAIACQHLSKLKR